MRKSPTLNTIDKNFSKLKKKFGIKSNDTNSKYFSFIIILYIFVTFLLLLYYKPKQICKEKMPYEESNNISYSKFLLYYLLLQIPLFIYIICSNIR